MRPYMTEIEAKQKHCPPGRGLFIYTLSQGSAPVRVALRGNVDECEIPVRVALRGNVDECEISDEERAEGVDVSALIAGVNRWGDNDVGKTKCLGSECMWWGWEQLYEIKRGKSREIPATHGRCEAPGGF